jgi:uncharacterized iron-regulated membrane protein
MFAEFARFTVKTDTERFLSLRAQAVQAVKQAHPGLVAAPLLVQHEDGSWTDVWVYRTEQEAQAANAGAGEIVGFMAMAAVLDGVSVEPGIVHQPGAGEPATGWTGPEGQCP